MSRRLRKLRQLCRHFWLNPARRSVDTPPAVAGFDGSPTCRGALMAIEAARRYAPAVSRRIHVAASIFVLKCGPRSWRTKIGGENLPTEDAAR